MPTFAHGDITGSIIQAAHAVAARLWPDHATTTAYNYAQALAAEVSKRGLKVATQVQAPRRDGATVIGHDRLDLVVADTVVVEVKKVKLLKAEHFQQLARYLRDSDKPVGLLITFNGPEPYCRRVPNRRQRR